MTPYELRYKIYDDARTILLNEYHHLYDEYKTGEIVGKPPAFPTHAKVMSLANKINEFVSNQKTVEKE
jgi:hypothetical protein